MFLALKEIVEDLVALGIADFLQDHLLGRLRANPSKIDRLKRFLKVVAYFDLGIAFSTGSGGVDVDLIQAHKWFNLAALGGSREGQQCRADVSSEMSRDEIAEAQRQARAWLDETARRPAARRFAA